MEGYWTATVFNYSIFWGSSYLKKTDMPLNLIEFASLSFISIFWGRQLLRWINSQKVRNVSLPIPTALKITTCILTAIAPTISNIQMLPNSRPTQLYIHLLCIQIFQSEIDDFTGRKQILDGNSWRNTKVFYLYGLAVWCSLKRRHSQQRFAQTCRKERIKMCLKSYLKNPDFFPGITVMMSEQKANLSLLFKNSA